MSPTNWASTIFPLPILTRTRNPHVCADGRIRYTSSHSHPEDPYLWARDMFSDTPLRAGGPYICAQPVRYTEKHPRHGEVMNAEDAEVVEGEIWRILDDCGVNAGWILIAWNRQAGDEKEIEVNVNGKKEVKEDFIATANIFATRTKFLKGRWKMAARQIYKCLVRKGYAYVSVEIVDRDVLEYEVVDEVDEVVR